MSLSLITDRIAADVVYYTGQFAKIISKGWNSLSATEQAEWLSASLKGGYWHTDLNRVGAAVQYIAGLLNAYAYPITVTACTNWTVADDITSNAMQAYLSDIENIKNRFYGTTVLPASISYMTHDDANNIEKLLLEVEANIDGMVAEFSYCGTPYSGE